MWKPAGLGGPVVFFFNQFSDGIVSGDCGLVWTKVVILYLN